LAIATEITVAGMAQATRVSVHVAQHRQAPIGPSDDPTRHRLPATIEKDVGGACVSLSAGWEGCQDQRFFFIAHAKQDPARFFVAARAFLVCSKPFEKRSADPIC
jgi:hypothetical protein